MLGAEIRQPQVPTAALVVSHRRATGGLDCGYCAEQPHAKPGCHCPHTVSPRRDAQNSTWVNEGGLRGLYSALSGAKLEPLSTELGAEA